MAKTEEKVACRTPAEGRDGVTNIPKWKFDLIAGHIKDVVTDAGPKGIPFGELSKAVGERLNDDERGRLGSVGWHSTTVKLEMEVAGILGRVQRSGRQHVVLAGAE